MTLLLSNLKVPYLSLKNTSIIAGCHYFSVISWCYPWIWILLLQWTSDVRLTDHLLHVLYLFSSYSLLSFIFPSTLMSKLFLFFVFYLSLSECLWGNDVQSLYYFSPSLFFVNCHHSSWTTLESGFFWLSPQTLFRSILIHELSLW